MNLNRQRISKNCLTLTQRLCKARGRKRNECGAGGIPTRGTLQRPPDYKSGSLRHSLTAPLRFVSIKPADVAASPAFYFYPNDGSIMGIVGRHDKPKNVTFCGSRSSDTQDLGQGRENITSRARSSAADGQKPYRDAFPIGFGTTLGLE